MLRKFKLFALQGNTFTKSQTNEPAQRRYPTVYLAYPDALRSCRLDEVKQNTYNLAGWQTSVNANYVNNGGSTGNWFGEVLSYDTGFTQS
ncbi:hypothetical protein, partial [Chitinophaga sp. sic0106]|uniref:hypothetical protein n=1 Tax=Chitinophaga sp. sic0106 TaxID=2854785 RepID=UPI001C45B5D1